MDVYVIIAFLLWIVQTIVSFAILEKKNEEIRNYKIGQNLHKKNLTDTSTKRGNKMNKNALLGEKEKHLFDMIYINKVQQM